MNYGNTRVRQALRTSVAVVAAAASLGLFAAPAVAQQAAVPRTMTYTVETLATGVNNGYQLAMDPVNRKVYFGDAQWRVEDRAEDGSITVRQSGSKSASAMAG